jgi:hypothetical protein
MHTQRVDHSKLFGLLALSIFFVWRAAGRLDSWALTGSIWLCTPRSTLPHNHRTKKCPASPIHRWDSRLNYFCFDKSKNNSNIYINPNINFDVDTIETANSNQIYNLKSLGIHYGNLSGGHYVSLCNIEDEFYLYNDNIVNKLKKDDVYEQLTNNNTGYLIVYELE